jgi:hypothetical protein
MGRKHCKVCARKINSDSTTMLCGVHYQAARMRTVRLCSKCSVEVSRQNKLGMCQTCTHASRNIFRDLTPDQREHAEALVAKGHSRSVALGFALRMATPARRQPIQTKVVNAKRIIAKVSDAMGIDEQSILSGGRWPHFVDARAVVVMAMRKRGASFCGIGRAIGRDHSTVIHLHRTFGARAAKVEGLAELVERVAA